MQIDWRTYWEKVKAWTLRTWEVVKTWCVAVWTRFSTWYMAQQEVIKKRSEVSHERLTVRRAVLLFMETWGLGSRNIFYTMWHLIWRPGYMISDYLNGHRKRYLQPFFMFFVLTLILVQMAWALDVQLPKNRDMTLTAFKFIYDHNDSFTVEQKTTILDVALWLDRVHDWRDENRAWDLIIHSIGICLITWLLWRKSPRVGQGEWVVDSGTMVDTWATVGSCAQIGKNVHLSGGVGIGGVLEPLQASPVIIEDHCFIGSRCIVVEGAHIGEEAVLGAGTVITGSTPIIDVSGKETVEYHGEVPPRSVVIPGSRTKHFPAGDYQVPCALIIGRRKESTDKKTSLNDALRMF